MICSALPLRRTLASTLIVLIAAGLSSCGSDTTSDGAGVNRVVATPSTLTLQVDETKAMSARAFDAAGTPLTRPLYWSVSDPTVVSVTQSGIVTGVSAGAAALAASTGGKSVVVPVTVARRAVALVRVTPATATIRVGATTALAAQTLDGTGAILTGRAVTWTTSSAAVATVNAAGVVTGVSTGNVTITGTSEGVRGTAVITVQPIPVSTVVVTPATAAIFDGATVALSAATRDSLGRALTGRVVAWQSSAATVASVSSTGVVLGVAPGTATITATSEGKSATSRVTVSPVPVASVTVSPTASTIAVGQTMPLVARTADSTGAPLNGRIVRWTTDRAAVATVNATSGVVTAVATGTARITATSEGKTGLATIAVSTVPVASIVVTPPSATLLPGQPLRLSAKTLDAQGRTLSGRPVTWIGGAPTVATVDSTGLVRAVAVGSANIVASSEGALARVPITVNPIMVTSVTVAPLAVSVETGSTVQLSVRIADALDRTVAGKVATWTSSNPALATVSINGRVSALAGSGTVTISATSDGITGQATVTVTSTPVVSIALAPSNPSVAIGGTLSLIATLYGPTPNVALPATYRTITWAISGTAASISPTGVVTGLSSGTATVTVTALSPGQAVPATATVDVTVP